MYGGRGPSGYVPWVCRVSAKFTPAASTSIRTSLRSARGCGSATSRSSSDSGPPRCETKIAFMVQEVYVWNRKQAKKRSAFVRGLLTRENQTVADQKVQH